jgi:hypothetical protein
MRLRGSNLSNWGDISWAEESSNQQRGTACPMLPLQSQFAQFASGTTQMHALWGLEFLFWAENHLNGSEITHCCIYTKIDRYIKMWGSFLCSCSAYWVWFYQILRTSRFFMQHEWLKESSFLKLLQLLLLFQRMKLWVISLSYHIVFVDRILLKKVKHLSHILIRDTISGEIDMNWTLSVRIYLLSVYSCIYAHLVHLNI